jgi:hypothetical protein
MDNDFFLKKLEEHKKQFSNAIIIGTPSTYDSYRYLVGRLKGLQDAEDLYKEIKKRNINEQ